MARGQDIRKAADAVAKAARDLATATDESVRHDARRRLHRAQARLERLAGEEAAGSAPTGDRRNVRSQRDVIVDTLDEVGAPMSTRAIAQYARGRFGAAIGGNRFAPLRRDEETAWRKNSSGRPVFIAPAINADAAEPISKLLTLTSWELADRIIGPRSERFAYLVLCRRVLQLLADNPQDEALLALSRRLHPPTRAQPVEEQLADIQQELELVRRLDEPDRVAAAERLGDMSADMLMWGNKGIVGVVEAKRSS
jgi:hypothetical protein